MNAALGMLLPIGAKGFHGKMGIRGIDDASLTNKSNLYRGIVYYTLQLDQMELVNLIYQVQVI